MKLVRPARGLEMQRSRCRLLPASGNKCVAAALSSWMRSFCGHNTSVWSFGDGSHDALGRPSFMGDAYEPIRIPNLPSDVCTVSAGHYHSLAVTSSGEVWAWGRNNEAQLGRGPALSSRDERSQPRKVQGLDQVKVRDACASGVVSMAVGEDGSLWVWGRSKRGQLGLGMGITEALLPTRVEALAAEDIVKVTLGWGHVLALTKEGKLYGWGYSAEGRLGRTGEALVSSLFVSDYTEKVVKNTNMNFDSRLEVAAKMVEEDMKREQHMPIMWKPFLVPELHGLDVVDVSCGHDHSLVLCQNGLLLSGGSNVYNQLGRASEGQCELQPVDVKYPPCSVSCGLGHSLAVCYYSITSDTDSCLFSWGWNSGSQLGRRGKEDIPGMVEALNGRKIKKVSGGRAHSVAVSCQGEVFSWGSGQNGRLGQGSSIDEPEPIMIEFLQGLKVLEAVCGLDHNLVLVAE